MSYAPRRTTIFPAGAGSLRPGGTNPTSSQQNPALQARISAKKAELENLRQLRELSGALAGQMTQLEEKLATLRDGTEAIAYVLSNWDNVLRAISLASAKLPIPIDGSGNMKVPLKDDSPQQLPQTLVRIPVAPPAESSAFSDRSPEASKQHEREVYES